MSQGIQERNLPVADSIGEGDKVRIVTAQGNSKNVDASQIGGGGNLVLTETIEEIQTRATTTQYLHTLSATYNEMVETMQSGGLLTVIKEDEIGGVVNWVQAILGQGDFGQIHPYKVNTAGTPFGDVGYYLDSPFGEEGYAFYSVNPDDAMTFTIATE